MSVVKNKGENFTKVMQHASSYGTTKEEYDEYHKQLRERVERVCNPNTSFSQNPQKAINVINGLKRAISLKCKKTILEVYSICERQINWNDFENELFEQWNKLIDKANNIIYS